MIKIIRTLFILCTVLSLILVSCTSTSNADLLPTLNTQNSSDVTQSSATSGGYITSDGGAYVIARGVCWDFQPQPTIKSSLTNDGKGIGSFVSTIRNLSSATTYYARAYATTASGTGYGEVMQITTPPDPGAPSTILNPDLPYGTISDIDGNKYNTIKIGTQTWMAENLRVTKYQNGENIPEEINNAKWNTLSSGARCTYNNNTEINSIAKFGRLYNYYAVSDARNIAPAGWHVATDAEWTILSNYVAAHLGTSASVAQSLATLYDWTESSVAGAIGTIDPSTINNNSGFCALPSGIRANYGYFNSVADYTGWWCSNQNDKNTGWFRSLSYYSTSLSKNVYDKHYGLSVRCIKN